MGGGRSGTGGGGRREGSGSGSDHGAAAKDSGAWGMQPLFWVDQHDGRQAGPPPAAAFPCAPPGPPCSPHWEWARRPDSTKGAWLTQCLGLSSEET